MQHIYGDMTRNKLFASDMVDAENDRKWRIGNRGFFARPTGIWSNEKAFNDGEDGSFGIAAFSEEEPYRPLYAARLPGEASNYYDQNWNENEAFLLALEGFGNLVMAELPGAAAA